MRKHKRINFHYLPILLVSQSNVIFHPRELWTSHVLKFTEVTLTTPPGGIPTMYT